MRTLFEVRIFWTRDWLVEEHLLAAATASLFDVSPNTKFFGLVQEYPFCGELSRGKRQRKKEKEIQRRKNKYNYNLRRKKK